MKKFTITFLTAFFCSLTMFAQDAERRIGEIIVQFTPQADLSLFFQKANRSAEKATFSLDEMIAPKWHIALLTFDENKISAEEVLALMNRDPLVQHAELNYSTEERDTEPNDTQWNNQWDMVQIGVEKAWDLTTGGLTPQGDTIVVATLERGYRLDHPDLAPSIWYNWAEIPNNGLDDDNNGFVDDFRGLDARNGGDSEGEGTSHGTSVLGIIGAQGNNNIGVSGLNWNVKQMAISNVKETDEIIRGYYYVYDARKLYNETNGAQGAFVVATNASFGINNERASDHPLWCAVYDSLGVVGVLSTGATTNGNVNVDVAGDMPTTCTSQYLISVTNTGQNDEKVTSAGYGSTHIDLGAPGENAYTTIKTVNEALTYGGFGGTSSATPHVTGAIGLMYAFPCTPFLAGKEEAPAEVARRVRDMILDNVVVRPSLSKVTTSGGRLDVAAAFAAAEAIYCEEARGDLVLNPTTRNILTPGFSMRYNYTVPNYEFSYKVEVYAIDGRLMYTKNLQPAAFQVNSIEIPSETWAAGKYFVLLFQGRQYVQDIFMKF